MRTQTAVFLLAAFGSLAGTAGAQQTPAAARASVTIVEHDERICKQEVARSRLDRNRTWWCVRGVARHAAGIGEVSVTGAAALLRTDSASSMAFTALLPTGAEARSIAILVRTGDGQQTQELFRLTPDGPDQQSFVLTNLRPRVLGGGPEEPLPVEVLQAVASAASAPPTPAAVAPAPVAPAATAGVAAAPAAAAGVEDPANQYIQIMEPREWSGVGVRGITTPARRSIRVMGFASHPAGLAGVEIDGRPAAITPDQSGGTYRFVGYVPADSVSRDVVVLVRGRSGVPVVGRYQLNATPAEKTFASRSEAWSPATGFRGKRWAVVVGISSYQDSSISQLRFADDDARAFYNFLRSPRAGGGGFAEENVKLLLNEQATYAELRSALNSFLRQATDQDEVIIYFAGHGAPDPTRPSDLYLLTHDARSTALPATAMPMAELNRAVEQLAAKHTVLITDACHSGGISRQMAMRGDVGAINRAFLDQLNSTSGGLAIFNASQANQTSAEDERWGGGHGVFTHFLLEALNGAADDDGDQIVTLAEAMHWTVDRVRRETHNAQIPSIGNRTYDPFLPVSMVLTPTELASISTAPPAATAAREPSPAQAVPARPGLSPALADSLARAQEAVRLFPNSAQYRSRLGQALMRVGQVQEGIAAFRDASRLAPQDPSLRYDLGMAFRDADMLAEAITEFEGAAAQEPQNGHFHHALGATLLQANRPQEAVDKLRRAVRSNEREPSYQNALGRALRLSGRSRDAVAALRTAVALDGGNALHHDELAAALVDDGNMGDAVVALREAVRLEPGNPAYHVSLGRLLQETGAMSEARATLATAVRLDSTNADTRNALGLLLQNLDLQYEAILEFRAAVHLAPDEASYHFNLGMLMGNASQPDSAVAHLQEAVRLEPQSAAFHNGLGQALRKGGRPAEALTALIQAVRLDATNGQFHYDLAMMYTEAGQFADALASLQQAVQLDRNNQEFKNALREAQRRTRN